MVNKGCEWDEDLKQKICLLLKASDSRFRNGITFRAFVRKSMDPLDLTGNCKQNIVIEPRTTEMT